MRTPRNGLGVVKSELRISDLRDGMTLDEPGMMFFGWWKENPPSLRNFERFAECWPGAAAEFNFYEFHSERPGEGHHIEVDVRLRHHPEEWTETITSALEYFVKSGASIAWVGGYECFVQYRPGCDFAGCYAAYTQESGLACLGGLDEPLRCISEEPQLVRRLNSIVAGSA